MFIAIRKNKNDDRVSLKTSGRFAKNGTIKEFDTMRGAIDYINNLKCSANDIMILEIHKDSEVGIKYD